MGQIYVDNQCVEFLCIHYKSKSLDSLKILNFLPQGSVLFNYIKHGKLERSDGSSITEGIGQGRVTANLKDAPIDDAHTILDTDAVRMVRMELRIISNDHT